ERGLHREPLDDRLGTRRGTGRSATDYWWLGYALRRQWETNDERAPFPQGTLDEYIASHPPGELSADRQPQPHAGARASLTVELEEWLEDPCLVLMGDTAAGIANTKLGPAIATAALDLHPPALRRELHRVRDQVDEDLP